MNTWESLIASRNRNIVTCRIESPTKRRAYLSKLTYCKSEKGKQARKGADARFREKHREERNEYSRNYYAQHREERNEYSRNYYAQHREYFAQYRLKLKQRKEVAMPCGTKKPTKKTKPTKKK